MKTQRCLSLLYRSIFALAAFVLLFQNVFGREILDNAKLGEMERVEATLTRRALPKWLQELPDSIPFWMKRAASKYRGAPHQILCAVVKLGKALNDMKAAKARNCDNYFRCRGSFDAAQCGVYAAAFASNIRYNLLSFFILILKYFID